MRAFRTAAAGEPLVDASLPTPQPAGTEVLLRTRATGVCHSDVHLHDGGFDLGGGKLLSAGAPGMTLGHEIVGDVVAIGPDATDVHVGERRVVYPWIGCGDCVLCEAGDEHLCATGPVIGVTRPGGFADHVLVPHPRYLFDPGSIDDTLACTCACSGLTAYSALRKVRDACAGGSLVIVGAGGVGSNAIGIARTVFGIDPVVADIDRSRLDALRESGVTHVVDPSDTGAAKAVMDITGGGAAAAIDFVGSESSSTFAIRCLRKGGALMVVGLFGGTFRFPLPMLPLLARTVTGSYVGSLADMAELMALAREGRIPPIPIVRRTASAAEATRSLEDLKAGRARGRIVLRF